METNIQKWGNSLGVRIPQFIAQKLALHPGSIVEIAIQDGYLTLYPKKYNFKKMMEQINNKNIHNLAWNGYAQKGKEEW